MKWVRFCICWVPVIMGGCAAKNYEVSFYFARGLMEEGRNGIDPGVETTDNLIRTPGFWRKFASRKLPYRISVAEEEQIHHSIRLSYVGEGPNGLAEVKLTVAGQHPVESSAIAEAIVAGLEQMMVQYEQGKHAPYVQRK